VEIKTIKDIKFVSDIMHDAEFGEGDFGFNSVDSKFFFNARAVTMQGCWFFQTRSPIQSGKGFHLELPNVIKYKTNLEQLKPGKSIAGVFNYIKIRKNGKKLTVISQDLHIELELSELAGSFQESE
jgi:hypothetical protein